MSENRNVRRAETLAENFAGLNETRQAYLSGFMDGLAFLHDEKPAAPGPQDRAVAAGPTVLR